VPHRDRLLFPRFTPVVYNGGVLCYAATSVSDAGHGRDGQPSSGISQKLLSPSRLTRVMPGSKKNLRGVRSLDLPYNKPEKALEVILTGGPTKVGGGEPCE